MLDEMSWDQLVTWHDYYSIEPFGDRRADLRAGVISSTIANSMVTRKGKPPFKPSDFMLDFDHDGSNKGKPITDKEQWARITQRAKAFAMAK